MSETERVDGFVVLKVKYKNDSSVIRHLFMKEHKVSQTCEQKPIGKTLFVINIPPFVDEYCIRHLFKDCGKIVDVLFHWKPTSGPPSVQKSKHFDSEVEINGYKVCFVVFNSHFALQKALKLSKGSEALTLRPESDEHLIGLKAMKQKYNESIVDSKALEKEINEYMSEYDKRVEELKLKAKQNEGIPDADGWIKVERHSKRKHLPNNQSNDQKVIEKHSKRRKKWSNELKNFYSFQMKESKVEYLTQMRNRFEDDKKKIALMKTQRKFRPF